MNWLTGIWTFFFTYLTVFATPLSHQPVKEIGKYRVVVSNGSETPVFLSLDWSHPQPQITRAVLMFHGHLRNADDYFHTAKLAQAAAGKEGNVTLLITPQFLTSVDVEAHHLSSQTLSWTWSSWEDGSPAIGPTQISSFAAIDAILSKLADRQIFPHLAQVVLAGHSGGGQVVQRYAIAGHGEEALLKVGVQVRYVIANPSSYAYFSKDRPNKSIAAHCPDYNKWKYGMDSRVPYLALPSASSLEKSYLARHVIYLLGEKDTDPNDEALDRSCMACAQGPNRNVRGHAYIEQMKARDGGTPNHKMFEIKGVGHDPKKMFTSACGLNSLFDLPGCGNSKTN